MKQIGLWIALTLLAVSCNDWLDVRSSAESKDKEQFSSVQGFYDALTGCYMALAKQDVYGERLTMSDIEALAGLWELQKDDANDERVAACYDLSVKAFSSDNARAAIQKIYAGLYNVIAQASMIIKYAEEKGGVFTDPTVRDVIMGEAYALRAYCQLDVLRLFGQLPRGGKQVELPYSSTTSIDEMPAYYGFDDYVEKLETDLVKAENLLQDNDPVFAYTFTDLNGKTDIGNDFLTYRQFRLNFWAVRALHARLELYIGHAQKALAIAREIIGATGADGEPVMSLSGTSDFAEGYVLCPSECLFCLSKYNVKTLSTEFLIGGETGVQYDPTKHLAITQDKLINDLFKGENTGSHNRFINCWNRKVQNNLGTVYAAIKKYWYDDDAEDQTLCRQLIPMLRMSEVYLIAMETSEDKEEVNRWYKEYMRAHDVLSEVGFTSLDEARKWVRDEHRREFFAEGQAFYTSKRVATDDSGYILPLPETEFNPNNLQN